MLKASTPSLIVPGVRARGDLGGSGTVRHTIVERKRAKLPCSVFSDVVGR